MPNRIQLSRAKGWRKPAGAIVVARPSKWGNPFRLRTPYGLARVPATHHPDQPWEYEGRISADGARHDFHHAGGRVTEVHVRFMTAAEVVECYQALLMGDGRWPIDFRNKGGYYRTVDEAQAELAGHDLACWCPLEDENGAPFPCHADVLLELANGKEVR